MYGPLTIPIIVVLAIATGVALGQFWRMRLMRLRLRRHARLILEQAQREGKAQVLDAELQVKQLLLEGNKKLEDELQKVRVDLQNRERSLDERLLRIAKIEEQTFSQQKELNLQQEQVNTLQQQLKSDRQVLQNQLAEIAGMSIEQAKQQLLATAQAEVQATLAVHKQVEWQKLQQDLEQRSQVLLVSALERCSKKNIFERAVCLVALPNSDVKGRIIGRDGRNIRAFEALTGVDVLMEELPEAAVISAHDPERREIARLALLDLIQDGRIQPTRIEQVVTAVKQNINAKYAEWGTEACVGFDFKVLADEVKLVLGKLKLRTSYGQNVLQHLRECAEIATILAAELRLNSDYTEALIQAALLHDIGKALPVEEGASHAIAGANFLKRHAFDPLVVNAVAAHHDEVPDQSILAPLIRLVDRLSAARPGARREDYQVLLKRLELMEQVAKAVPGVTQAFVVQAGRELHVMVDAQVVSDQQISVIAQELTLELQKQISSSAPVRINVLRQSKAISVATWSA